MMKKGCFLLLKTRKALDLQGLLCWGNVTSLLLEAQHHWALAHIVDAEHHIVGAATSFCVRKRNDVILRINDVASKLANDVVS